MSTAVHGTCVTQSEGGAAPGARLRAAGRGGLALVAQALVSGMNFGTSLLVGRFAGPDELGVYSLGFTLVVVAMSFQDSLVSSPYTVYGNRLEGEDRSRLAGAALAQLVM